MSLRELIEQPFGPYAEHEAFTSSVPQTTVKHPLRLHNVMIEWGGTCTGLDECEKWQPEERHDIDPSIPQRFSGTLEIEHLSWLTPDVVSSIEAEIRRRDQRARSANHRHARPSNITLQSIYAPTPFSRTGGHLRIKLTIQATKSMAAKYLDSNHVPFGLMMNSVWTGPKGEEYRRYEIASLHIFSYELSRAYLSRFRLYYILSTLLKLDADSNTITANRTPLNKRTPKWFIELYMKHNAYHGSQRHHRPHWASSDTDIEPGTHGQMRAHREHTLRHVSRAEIHYRIVEHAEWLIRETENRRMNKLFDVDVWKKWYSRVKRLRKEADRAGRPFRVEEDIGVTLNDAMDVDDPPLPPDFRKRKQAAKKPPKRRDHLASHAASSSHFSAPRAHRFVDDDSDDMDVNPTMQRDYDPDFSPESSDNEPPSSDSGRFPSRSATPTDPDLIALLPSAFFYPANATSTGKWVCAAPQCRYTIDLHNLTDENLNTTEIRESDKEKLLRGLWSGRDVWARDAFACMVDKHYNTHLDEWGIKFEEVNGRWRARWRDGMHGHSPLLRKVKKDERRVVEEVKQGDV